MKCIRKECGAYEPMNEAGCSLGRCAFPAGPIIKNQTKKVYLAARYSQKGDMQCVAAILQAKGIEVTSSWLSEQWPPGTTMDQIDVKELAMYAEQDLADIAAVDTLILFSIDPMIAGVRGGRHVEFGYALGIVRRVIVVGVHENIFHYIPKVEHCATIVDLLKLLGV